jgi:putative transposase
MLSVVVDERARSEFALDLDELVLQGARRMLAAALEAEVAAYIEAHAQEQDERGHRLVRRNGHARERTIATGAGPIPVAAPRVDDRRLDPLHRREGRLHERDPAALVPQEPQGQRGPAAAVSARACPPATSCLRWRRSSARPLACRPRW